MTERQTVSGAYDKIAAHEVLCAERYKNIHGRLDLLFHVIGWGGSLAAALVVGIAGWGLNKVFDAQKEQMRALQQVAAQVERR